MKYLVAPFAGCCWWERSSQHCLGMRGRYPPWALQAGHWWACYSLQGDGGRWEEEQPGRPPSWHTPHRAGSDCLRRTDPAKALGGMRKQCLPHCVLQFCLLCAFNKGVRLGVPRGRGVRRGSEKEGILVLSTGCHRQQNLPAVCYIPHRTDFLNF